MTSVPLIQFSPLSFIFSISNSSFVVRHLTYIVVVKLFILNFISLSFSYFQPWPEDALELVAVKFLETLELTEVERQAIVPICKHFHTSVMNLSERLILINILITIMPYILKHLFLHKPKILIGFLCFLDLSDHLIS